MLFLIGYGEYEGYYIHVEGEDSSTHTQRHSGCSSQYRKGKIMIRNHKYTVHISLL